MNNSDRAALIILLSLCFTLNILAQHGKNESRNLKLTGNLSFDSGIIQERFDKDYADFYSGPSADKKSPVKAGLFSLVVPGAGQVYNHDYLLASVFVVVEAALITTAVIYNKKGNDKTDEFQNFADQHWNVETYAHWTLDHLNDLNPNLDAGNYNVFDSNGNVIWSELNRLETDIGDGYSHNLPVPGVQQYYEEIGKYPQFSHGWDDANYNDTDFHILSPRFLYYSGLRGDANDLYTSSTRAITGIYINHVLAALEAVWGASRFNKNISMRMRVNPVNLTGRMVLVPTMNLKINF